jgi:hypothetical protein
VIDIRRGLPLLLLLPFCVPMASAQSSVDFAVGFGAAYDKANGGGIDSAASPLNAYGSCIPNSGDSFCQPNPKLSGFFLGFGGDVMLWKHFGIGAELNTQPSRSNYGPLEYRQTFYDVNGVFAPVNTKRITLQLQGGIGGARTSFAINQSGCVGTAVCTSSTTPVGNASHFQVHAGIGVSLFVTEHVFIRPQFDAHYVPGLNNQFNSNFVPEGTIWLGYNFGER